MIISDVIKIEVSRCGNVAVFFVTLSTGLQCTIPPGLYIEIIDLTTIKIYK